MLFPFQAPFFLAAPSGVISWLGWGILCLFILLINILVKNGLAFIHWKHRQWIVFGGLMAAILLTTPFLGIQLSINNPSMPAAAQSVSIKDLDLMFLSAVPWMLCGGLSGVLPAVLLGGLSGFLLSFLDTHNPYTILEFASLALIFSLAIRQRYQTLFFRLIRHPFFAAILTVIAYIPIGFYSPLLIANGSLLDRVSFAVPHFLASFIAISGTVLFAGLITEAVAYVLRSSWGRTDPLRPSPAESSMLFRFISASLAGALFFFCIFAIANWIISEQSAQTIVKNQLVKTAQFASENISLFQDTGQNLIGQFASDNRLASPSKDAIIPVLEEDLRINPFFSELILLDQNQQILASYPSEVAHSFELSQDDKVLLNRAFTGVNYQVFAEIPQGAGEPTRVVFLAAIAGESGQAVRVLWGRTDLASNPLIAPVIKALQDQASNQSIGELIDNRGTILYRPLSSLLLPIFGGNVNTQPSFSENSGSDGTQLVYYQPVLSGSWAVVLSVPMAQINQLAFDMAFPLAVVVFAMVVIASITLSFGMKKMTRSLVTLTTEAQRITQGKFDNPFSALRSEDEVGKLRDSFEQMRISLTARVEELNRLLQVSQGVASSLVITDAIYPILEAAYNHQACLASVVLADDEFSGIDVNIPRKLSIGPASQVYAFLDEEILRLTRQRGLVVLSNLTRGRALDLAPHTPHPGSLIAVALRHEARFYGALWVAYDNPRIFTKEEISFLDTLAGEAALAAANAQLYSSAEVGRQRLEAILASTPEPVLVTDPQYRLLLTNPAALQLPGLGDLSVTGKPVTDIIYQNELLSMLTAADQEPLSREIVFPNGRTYQTTVSTVIVANKMLGKVCMLKDITHYKELDNQKSEFVATVSHDLRFPLTLIWGYTTMLPMVGDLNEQQKGYVHKLNTEVENISRLVNDVLDLGRIEAGIGLRIGKFSARVIADYVVSSLQAQANQKSIQLSVEVPFESQLELEADSALLQEAIYNMVENAIKYTPVRGRVKVVIESLPTSILYSVHDTGVGIAPIDQPRLFEKFYRGGQRESAPSSGSGLGLAIVKSVAERHGGRAWLESILGKGSVFFLEIPRHPMK